MSYLVAHPQPVTIRGPWDLDVNRRLVFEPPRLVTLVTNISQGNEYHWLTKVTKRLVEGYQYH